MQEAALRLGKMGKFPIKKKNLAFAQKFSLFKSKIELECRLAERSITQFYAKIVFFLCSQNQGFVPFPFSAAAKCE